MLMEQLHYNPLYRWFVGLDMDEPVWASTVFSKNRDRLLTQAIARSFFRRVVDQAAGLMSDAHFTSMGRLLKAGPASRVFQRKDGGSDGEVAIPGQERKYDTHASEDRPEARSNRKSNGAESRLPHLRHLPIENRRGQIADGSPRSPTAWRARAATGIAACQWQRAPGAAGPCAPARHMTTRNS